MNYELGVMTNNYQVKVKSLVRDSYFIIKDSKKVVYFLAFGVLAAFVLLVASAHKPLPVNIKQGNPLSQVHTVTTADTAGPVLTEEKTPQTKFVDKSQDSKSTYSWEYQMGGAVAKVAKKDGSSPSYAIVSEQSSLGFTLKDASVLSPNKKPSVYDDVAIYPVGINGVQMQMELTTSKDKVKEQFIIDKKPKPSCTLFVFNCQYQDLKISFDVKTQGLIITEQAGAYNLTSQDGTTNWLIEAPTAIDATGKSFPIEGKLDKDTYSLVLHPSSLKDMQYPIVVDPTVIISTSSTTDATQPSTMRHLVRTSDATLHSFIQMGTNTTKCGSGGLWWLYSTDSGTTWNCGGQLSSDTTNLMYADARVDSSDNVYVVYSVANSGGNTAYDVFYRRLTASNCSPTPCDWTLESAQTALNGDGSGDDAGFHYATIELQGTTRAWIAVREYDGTNYQVGVYYSDSLGTAPTWTASQTTLDTATTESLTHIPTIARYGSNLAVFYTAITNQALDWRYRADSDSLASWAAAATVIATGCACSGIYDSFSVASDSNGHLYLAWDFGTDLYFTSFNGVKWSSTVTFTSAGSSFDDSTSVTTDGANAWVFYLETTGLSGLLLGDRKLVYRKCSPPFTSSDCDSASTAVVSYQTVFDKVWTFAAQSGGSYEDETTDAGDTDSADVIHSLSGGGFVQDANDAIYLGVDEKFDALSWVLSNSGTSGVMAWEYCSAVDATPSCTSWSSLTFSASSATNFTSTTGYGEFNAPSDWQAAKVNGEGTAYYYLRARVTSGFGTTPIGTQFAAIPQINWVSAAATVVSNTAHLVWTENAGPTRVRYSAISVSTSSTPASTVNIDPKVVGYSATTNATQPSTMRHIVRTSEGTLHAFVQSSTQLACGGSGGNNNYGLMWISSTDTGSTWTCQGQLSSNTTNLMYADARVDSSDNIYVVYSVAATSGNAAYDVFYRKLTSSNCSPAPCDWTLESAQTVLDGDGSGDDAGFHYATIELQGTTRAWIAAREYDGTNYQVGVYYSDGLTAAPTWTVSDAALGGTNSDSELYKPVIVRYGSNIGVIYGDGGSVIDIYWRFRTDSDAFTVWAAEALVIDNGQTTDAEIYSAAVSDGRIYFVQDGSNSTELSYYNGIKWSSILVVSSATTNTDFVSVSTDGTNAWVFYGETTGLSGSLSGSRKLVYKKCVPPFASTTDCDASSTAVVSYHGTFDKYWSYVSAVYTDDTTDAGNTTTADTQMVTGVGDIAYFGKTAKFDAISWDVSTSGAGGQVVWEYWNGSAWMQLTDFLAISNQNFTADGYMTFIPHTDWATTNINGEGTAYYYIRARVTTAYTTSPVGVQMASIPRINWASVAPNVTSNTIHGIWTENAGATTRVRYSPVSVTASSAPSSTANIDPKVVGYSDTTLATRPSTMRNIVRTSDGTLHAFVASNGQLICGGASGNNNFGLMWISSTDSGTTWTCQSQLSTKVSNPYNASAVVDSSDNIYIVYSLLDQGGAATALDVFYRKLTKGPGATWTVESAQTVLDGTSSVGYTAATIELEGTTRAWIAARYYDGANYQVGVYYSDGLTAAPTWTVSQATLDTAGTNSTYHIPTVVRFGSNIGVIYTEQVVGGQIKWRYRADSDGLTSWVSEGTVTTSVTQTAATFSATGDVSGNIYFATNWSTNVYFTRWNSSSWSSLATVSSAATSNAFVSVATDGTSVWVAYGETTGLTTSLSGSRRLVYKKGVAPFATGNFDASSTPLVTRHAVFDKVWLYDADAGTPFQDETTDAGNTTSADVLHATSGRVVAAVGDIVYFGKTQKFDAISWDLSTNGSSGLVIWEYYNGSTWAALTDFLVAPAPHFTADSYFAFIPYTDWATTTVNGEGTAYYYIRARVTTAYTTGPIGVQMAVIPQINWASFTANVATNKIYGIWTENAGATTRVRFSHFSAENGVKLFGGTKINGGTRLYSN